MPVSVWTQDGVEQGINHTIRHRDTNVFICLVAGDEKSKPRVFPVWLGRFGSFPGLSDEMNIGMAGNIKEENPKSSSP